MDLFSSLNNINNNERKIINKFDLINNNKFNIFIPQHQINIIYTSINRNNISKKIKDIKQVNNKILLNKIIKLSSKNNKLEKIINLLKIIISDLKKEKQKLILNKINEKSNNNILINPLSIKDIEIKELKTQIKNINIINKDKIMIYNKKLHFFLLENYQLKKEIYHKNEEFIKIQKKLEITEKRVKETLFNIKYGKLNSINDENSKVQKILINKEKNENFLIKNNIQTENIINKEKLKDKNLSNSSFKDIENTTLTSLDISNNTNLFNYKIKNIINIKEKIE